MDLELDSLSPHRGDSIVGNRERRSVAGDFAHLEAALATVDGLEAGATTDPSSEHVLYQLGEASHLVHYASLVLTDCTEASAPGGVCLTALAVTP